MACVCGGDLVKARLGAHATDEDREEALLAFLSQAGPSTEATIVAWGQLRSDLIYDLALVHLLETGQIEAVERPAGAERAYRQKAVA